MDFENIVKKMSLREKLAELTQVNANILELDVSGNVTGLPQELNLTAEDTFNIGSVLNFGGINEIEKIQKNHLAKNKRGIPLLFMLDVVHGDRTIYPIPLGIGATFDPDLARRLCKMAATEARAEGINVTFAPMVDLCRDARWGRCMESTGEDPYLNSVMGAAMVEGFQDDLKNTGVASCVKHFGCYGQAEAGRDYNTTDMSEYRLRNYYLKSYEACVKNGAKMIMSSFNSLNGTPCAGNEYLLKDILRDEWGFDGVLISDYSGIIEQMKHGVAEDESQCALRAIKSTTDVEMMSTTYLNSLEKLVADGEVQEKDIDEALIRFLKLKEDLGAFDEKKSEIDPACIMSEKHRDLAREGATKSCVLLKNDGVLPLSTSEKSLLVVGPAAAKGMNGNWSCHGRSAESVTLFDGIKNVFKNDLYYAKGFDIAVNSKDYSLFDEVKPYLDKVDTVVVALGEDEYMSGESFSRANLSLSKAQINLVTELKKANKKVVSVVYSGRPLSLTDIVDESDAIIEAWMPGTEGGNALADLIFGKANFEGKLPMTFPRSVGQCPIYYNHLNTGRPKPFEEYTFGYCSFYIDELNSPLFPFGYGLSYSAFEISKVVLDKKEMKRNQKITASVKVKNVSSVAGTETVQLYVRDLVASLARPVKELKDFKKVFLAPNEEKTVSFEIDEEKLKFFNAKNDFVSENGTFSVMIGGDSSVSDGATFELIG